MEAQTCHVSDTTNDGNMMDKLENSTNPPNDTRVVNERSDENGCRDFSQTGHRQATADLKAATLDQMVSIKKENNLDLMLADTETPMPVVMTGESQAGFLDGLSQNTFLTADKGETDLNSLAFYDTNSTSISPQTMYFNTESPRRMIWNCDVSNGMLMDAIESQKTIQTTTSSERTNTIYPKDLFSNSAIAQDIVLNADYLKLCNTNSIPVKLDNNIIIEPRHEIFNNLVCATSKGSDQTAHTRSLIRAFASHLNMPAKLDNNKFECGACGKQFSTGRRLRTHHRIHTGEKPFKCKLCPKAYQDHCGLKSHIARVHSGKKPYVCQVCIKAFAESRDLKSHMVRHSDNKAYSCAVCSKGFKRENDLKIHMFVHTGEDQYACEVCQKTFSTRSRLKTHRVTHTKETPHKCELCEKSFSLVGNLREHIVRMHGGEKRYSCSYCDKTFSGSSNLKCHLLLHTGEKPHVCEVCEKRFTRLNHLKDHLRLHTGETPYVCGVCNKQYKFACSYKIHMRAHSGEAPYSCDNCKKTFKHSSNLKRHSHKCRGFHNAYDGEFSCQNVVQNMDSGQANTSHIGLNIDPTVHNMSTMVMSMDSIEPIIGSAGPDSSSIGQSTDSIFE